VLGASRKETEMRDEHEMNDSKKAKAGPVGIGGDRIDPSAYYLIEGSPDVHQLVDHCKYLDKHLAEPLT
jgi:hypothetical protein